MIRFNYSFQPNIDAGCRNTLATALELISASQKYEGYIAFDALQNATRSLFDFDVFNLFFTNNKKKSFTPTY